MKLGRLMITVCTILIPHEFLKLYKIDKIMRRMSIERVPVLKMKMKMKKKPLKCNELIFRPTCAVACIIHNYIPMTTRIYIHKFR